MYFIKWRPKFYLDSDIYRRYLLIIMKNQSNPSPSPVNLLVVRYVQRQPESSNELGEIDDRLNLAEPQSETFDI